MGAELIAGAKIITKLMGAGLAAYRAVHASGLQKELEDACKALQDVLDAGGPLSARSSARIASRVQARHVALVVGAFGEAWADHYRPRHGLRKDADLARHREAAVAWALMALPRLGSPDLTNDLALIDHLLVGVIDTPYYCALWEAFTHKALPDLESRWTEPLIAMVDGDDRRAFEAKVRRAYAETLASPAGADLRSYLLELPSERGRIVRELSVRDLATWRRRQMFGNAATHARLPDMPLGEMYVEPRSFPRAGPAVARPVLAHMLDALTASPLIVVTAHFGHGKSLTARTLAWRLAADYLGDATPDAARPLPMFIKCLEDLDGSDATLPRMVERALWRQVGLGFKLGLKDTDPAFGAPPDTQSTIFLIDGLDEVALTPSAITRLFEHLRGQATGRHKVIVFSRPEILPDLRLRELGVPVLELKPFSTENDGQVAEWLANWNTHSGARTKIRFDELDARGLLELAQTPILLFMIAEAWDTIDQAPGAVRQATLYEAFLRRVAHGKHDNDSDQHRPIALAAQHLYERLLALGRIAGDATLDDAMLWVLSRMAWESHCLEQREKFLTQRKVTELLDRELGVDDEGAYQTLCDGVLLALQADFAPSGSRILFGHRSFREFLVARYWVRTLQLILHYSPVEWPRREAALLGGRLLGREDRSFAFLIELVESWDASQRAALRQWAEQTFNDERISRLDDSDAAILIHDRRAYLREAALAIGSCATRSTGIEARNTTVLRSLLAWFVARGEPPIIEAPGLRHPGAQLEGLTLSGANLRGADLHGCSLGHTVISNSNLSGAKLTSATLHGMRLFAVKLAKADLTGANATNVAFRSVQMQGANLTAADLRGSHFEECEFANTVFSDAKLNSCKFSRSPRGAGTTFDGADLREAIEVLHGQTVKRDASVAEIVHVVQRALGTREAVYVFYDIPGFQDDRQAPGSPDGISLKQRRIEFQIRVPCDEADTIGRAIDQLQLTSLTRLR